jgi:hypothetical protein
LARVKEPALSEVEGRPLWFLGRLVALLLRPSAHNYSQLLAKRQTGPGGVSEWRCPWTISERPDWLASMIILQQNGSWSISETSGNPLKRSQ